MAQGYTGNVDYLTERITPTEDNSGTSYNSDASQYGVFKLIANNNFTLENPTGAVDGQKLMWRITQDGTGSRTITLGTKFRVASDINSGVVTLSTAASTRDYLGAVYDADDDRFDVIGFTKGIDSTV